MTCNVAPQFYWDQDNKKEWFPLVYMFFLTTLGIIIGISIYKSI